MTFTTGPAVLQPAGRGSPASAAVRTGIGVGEHDAGAQSPRRSRSSTPSAARRDSSTRIRSTGASSRTVAPAATAARRSASVTAPIPPRAKPQTPGSPAASPRSWKKPTNAVPGSDGPASVPISPWIANGTRTASVGIPARSSAIEPVEDLRADGIEPALAIGGLEHQRPGACRRLLPALGPLAVAGRVTRRPVRGELARRALARGPRHDLATVRLRREQVRLVRHHLEPVRAQAELVDDPRPQQRQRVRAGRRADAGPQLLGHAAAADDVAPFEDLHVEPGAREVRRGDEAVVPGADDQRVTHRRAGAAARGDLEQASPPRLSVRLRRWRS